MNYFARLCIDFVVNITRSCLGGIAELLSFKNGVTVVAFKVVNLEKQIY